MKETRVIQAHLYIDSYMYPKTAKKAKELIAKRKLNTLMVKLLEEYFKKEPEQHELFK